MEEVQHSLCSSERTLAALLISPGTFRSERMRDQNSLYSLLPLVFLCYLSSAFTFFEREWENRLNISEHFRISLSRYFLLISGFLFYFLFSERMENLHISNDNNDNRRLCRMQPSGFSISSHLTRKMVGLGCLYRDQFLLVCTASSRALGKLCSYKTSSAYHNALYIHTYIHCTLVHMPSKSRSDFSHW